MYEQVIKTNVLVIGAGLAGLTAALRAADCGADVCLVSRARIGSGSSFYEGTWGLGLIGPENPEDEKDLWNTILDIGQGMADPELAEVLVHGITPAIRRLENRGIPLKKAVKKEQKEFIPCFDHKLRAWHGLEKASVLPVLNRLVKEKGIHEYPETTVVDLIRYQGWVCGAWALRQEKATGQVTRMIFQAGAVVLASGGFGGIFSRCLTTDDCRASGHALALRAGARVSNMEFMQMMPGFLSPAYKTIYNEKMFGFSRFRIPGPDGRMEEIRGIRCRENAELLAERGTHGPFTCRLASGEVDRLLFQACQDYPEGVELTYHLSGEGEIPEFVRTYFEWLEKDKHLTMKDPVHVAIFAHASNGGVCIDPRAWTGVPGLYACGEVTGGMHGADRLGGLSTANGLVFGEIAGAFAAGEALGRKLDMPEKPGEDELILPWLPEAPELRQKLRSYNDRHGMVVREGDSAGHMLELLDMYEKKLAGSSWIPWEKVSSQIVDELLETWDLQNTILVSRAMYKAILGRRESRGSHYRRDYPDPDAAFSFPTCYALVQGKLCAVK